MSLSHQSSVAPAGADAADSAEELKKARISHRKHAASAGIIYSNEINGAVRCIVRDMSVTGAKLAVRDSKHITKTNGKMGLPELFTLNIRLDRIAVDCRVVWQKDDEVGVRFTAPPRVLSRTLR